MGVLADRDLQENLTGIIDGLRKHADAGASLTPESIRVVARTLTIVRDCHQTLADAETQMRELIADELATVTPIRGPRAVGA